MPRVWYIKSYMLQFIKECEYIQIKEAGKIIMTKAQRERDKKYKKFIFLSAYLLFVIIKLITDLAHFNHNTNPSSPSWPGILAPVTTIMMWCVCFVITATIRRRRIFQAKSVIFLFMGFSIWILWGAFANFSGLSFAGGWNAYREFLVLSVFTHVVFMTVKIVKIYRMKRQFAAVTLIVLGAMLLYAFIAFFRGLDFIDSIYNLFKSGGRYRYAYGFRHVNTSGRLCVMFLIYTMIYRSVSEQDRAEHIIRSDYTILFAAMFPAVLIILLSSASRAAISALILFYCVYFVLRSYSHTQKYSQALYIIFVFALIMSIIILIDWQALWDIFWRSRGVNYVKSLPFLTDRNLVAAGVGMMKRGQIDAYIGSGLMDSFYLTVLLQTGIVGCIIFFGTVSIFVLIYFSDMKHMNRLQCLTGGLIALIIYYGLFEGGMFFKNGPLDLMNWVFIITCMNEKKI